MSIISHYYYSACQRIIEAGYNRGESFGDILMLHQVTDNKDEWSVPNCSITEKSFETLVESLIIQKRSFGALENADFGKTSPAYYITFDDAYMDVLTNAAPILQQYEIPFTVFIAVNLLNKPGYLTIDALKQLAALPLCTVGAHTFSHSRLRTLESSQASSEIVGSGKALSELIGKPVELFAYPYGSLYACSDENIKQVMEAGYKAAFSTLNCSLSAAATKNRWFLPRRNVNEKNYIRFLKGE